jgi:hypothetical protein
MRRGLAPKKSADHNPPAHDSFVREGLASASAPRCFYFQALHTLSSLRQVKIKPLFFGEVSERRPWAQNPKTARLPLPGAPNPNASLLFCCWDTARAYTGEYPIPPACSVTTVRRSGWKEV